jgi:hypothetical protein
MALMNTFWRPTSIDSFQRIFTGNAFEGPPITSHQRPRLRRRLRRTLRALMVWLLQPQPLFTAPSSKHLSS